MGGWDDELLGVGVIDEAYKLLLRRLVPGSLIRTTYYRGLVFGVDSRGIDLLDRQVILLLACKHAVDKPVEGGDTKALPVGGPEDPGYILKTTRMKAWSVRILWHCCWCSRGSDDSTGKPQQNGQLKDGNTRFSYRDKSLRISDKG